MHGGTPRHPDAPARYGGRGTGSEAASASPAGGRPPLGRLRAPVAVAVAYGAAALLWVVVGPPLPGGRWLAVHLFTLGAMTNLIVVMTDHFARTITRVPGDERRGWRLVTLNVGVVLVVVGLPAGSTVALAAGATVATAGVMWLYLALRGMRRRALGPRFGYVVRAYERACGAFLHGAILGALLGIGLLAGDWYASVRLAHLAVNVLGWGGLVLLATLVFFAPTVMRTDVDPAAERLAVPALRHGTTALTVGVLGLILAAAPGAVGITAHAVAVAGLAGFTAATVAICLPVLRTARHATPSPQARHVAAASAWFPVAVALGTLGVALDAAVLVTTAGALLLLAVLGQAILGTLVYLLPMVTAADHAARTHQRGTLAAGMRLRVTGLNLGAAGIAATVALPGDGPAAAWLAPLAWSLYGATLAATLAIAATALVRARPQTRSASV